MDNKSREHGRYGKSKSQARRKSYKNTPHQDWDKQHASDYLNSDEGKQHAAMQAQAQNLMAQPEPTPQPGAAGPASAAPVAAAMPQGA